MSDEERKKYGRVFALPPGYPFDEPKPFDPKPYEEMGRRWAEAGERAFMAAFLADGNPSPPADDTDTPHVVDAGR
jgi:hypothetical protein